MNIETNVAIDEGLWYLHQQQTRTASDDYPSGYWFFGVNRGNRPSASGSAIQAFEINGHLESGNHMENPYCETVDRGLKYLFTLLRSAPIDNQTYGNPDTNGNGIGVEVNEAHPIYQDGMVMDAIASSNNPLTRTVTGSTDITRRSYFDVLTDLADQYNWGQVDHDIQGGGWRSHRLQRF